MLWHIFFLKDDMLLISSINWAPTLHSIMYSQGWIIPHIFYIMYAERNCENHKWKKEMVKVVIFLLHSHTLAGNYINYWRHQCLQSTLLLYLIIRYKFSQEGIKLVCIKWKWNFISIQLFVVVLKKTDCFKDKEESDSRRSCTWWQPWIPQRQRAWRDHH